MTQQQPYALVSGILPMTLGNACADAITAALERGMEPDEACSVVLQVVTDYWRAHYDNGDALTGLVAAALQRPPTGALEWKAP